ncbi:MAG: proton-conducting transporter membrane subunit, partial [Bacteroidota bacterium]
MVEQTLQYLLLFLPETTLIAAFCVAILSDLIFRKKPQVSGGVAFVGMLLAGYFAIRQLGLTESVFHGMVAVDPFAVFFKLLVTFTTLIILLFSLYSAEVQSTVKRMGEYYSLLIAMSLGMFLMAGAANLLMMILALELTSLSSYILAGYTKEAPDSSEASLKYILYGAVSSGVMLYGVSILFGLTGTTDIYGINKSLAASSPNAIALLIATIFIIVGFGYKISAVPFHFWTPDVY